MWKFPCSGSLSLALFFSAWFWATTWDQPLSLKPLCSSSPNLVWLSQYLKGARRTPGCGEVSTLDLTAEHPAHVRKPRKQSAFSDSVSKALVHISYHTGRLSYYHRNLAASGLLWELLVSLFGILVPGLGFALPCDNFNPNAFFSFLFE